MDGALQGSKSTCVAVSCQPGDFALCRGDTAVTCNAEGTDYDLTACEHGCDATAKGCVSCVDDTTCTMTAPHCDVTTHTCRGCRADTECSSAACDLGTGMCVDASSIVYAAPNGSSSGTCTQATPCTLIQAFAVATPNRSFIKLAAGNYQTDGLTVSHAALVVSGDGSTISRTPASGTTTITVTNSGSLRIHGARLVGAANDTAVVTCSSTVGNTTSNLDLDHVIVQPVATGVAYVGCTGKITHATFEPTSAAGLDLRSTGAAGSGLASEVFIDGSVFASSIQVAQKSRLHVTNSVFQGAGSGLSLATTAVADVSFSTFYNAAFACANLAPTAQSNGYSNIFVALGGDALPTSTNECAHHYTLSTPQSAAPARSDHMLLNMDPLFTNVALGDFHLLAGSPAIDAADPAAPAGTDFDGTARPQGAHSDMGAFEFKP